MSLLPQVFSTEAARPGQGTARPLKMLAAAVAIVLADAAGIGLAQVTPPAAPPERVQSAPSATPAPAAKPASALTADMLYQTLLAEIAAARGQADLAAYLYVGLAEQTQDVRIARRATELGLMSGQTELTGRAVKLWAALEPNAPSSLQALALAMSGQMAKLEDMEPPLRRMLDSETTPNEALLLQLPGLLLRYPDKAAALAMIERLTQPYLQKPEAYLARAVMALSANDLAKAERASQKALDLRPDWEPAARIKAQSVPKARKAQAMEELGRFGKRYPQSIGAREDYARWLLTEGRKAEATEAYDRLRSDFPENDDVLFGSALLMLQAGETDKAEPILRRLIERNYRNADQIRLQLGVLLEDSSRADEAITVYKAVKPGPHYLAARARAAQVLLRQGKSEEARALLAEASAQSPSSAQELVLAQASILRQNKQTPEALEVLEKHLAGKPDDAEVLYQAGMLAEELKRYDKMEQLLRRLITLKPDQSAAYNALGYSLADRNVRLAEADKLLSRAIKISPNEAAIVDSMGWLRFRQNKLGEAVKLLRRAYDLQADPEIAAHLGEALWKQGRRAEARKVLEQARKTFPDNAALKAVMGRLLK